MDYVFIGKIVSSHGLKGEVKILSNFEYKEIVFIPGINIYIGKNLSKETINSYRHHKNYEMITMNGYNKIEDVEKYLKKSVYIIKDEIPSLSDKILDQDLIGLDSYINKKFVGKVNDVYNTGANYKVIEIKNDDKKKIIPYHKDFIENIDLKNKKIIFKEGVF